MIDPIHLSLFQGKFDEFDRLLSGLHNEKQKLYGLLWKVNKLLFFNEEVKALELIEEIFSKTKDSYQEIYIRAQLLQIRIFILSVHEIERISLLFDGIEKTVDKLSKTDDLKELNGYYLKSKAFYTIRIIGDYDDSLKYYNKAKMIFEDLGDKLNYADVMANLSYVYRLLKKFDLSFEHAEIAEMIFKETECQLILSMLYNDIGLIYRDAGDQLKSIKAFKRAMEIGESLEINHLTYASLNIIEQYINRGEFKKALDLGLNRINNLEELNQINSAKEGSIEPYNFVGSVYRYMGDYEQALHYHLLALQKWQSIPITQMFSAYLSFGYYQVISTLLLIGKRTKAEDYMLKFDEMVKSLEKKDFKNFDRSLQYLELSKALILKFSPRMINKVQAQEKLKNILDKDIYFTPDKFDAMKHLCDLYLYELKSEPSDEIVKEARNIIEKLKIESKEKNMLLWLIKSYILLSKFALIDNNPNEALNYIEEAEKVASNQKLISLMDNVKKEKENLENQILKWKKIIDTNPGLEERIKMSNLEEYIKTALIFTKN